MTVAFQSLPFDEAISFLRDKVNLPSENWTDLWQDMHSRAFVVSGATKNELLVDIHNALNNAIAQGTTFNDFKKRFREIVAENGWTGSEGSPITDERSLGYRAATIFNTNMRTSYAAGNERQMQSTKKARPYARYIGGLSRRPRKLHLEWNGIILPLDHPWWKDHTPPNGWGCKCKKVSMSVRELDREGLSVSDAPDDGFYDWTNPNTGKTIQVPNGIDPGWAYNPGKAAWGQEISNSAMSAWKKEGAKAWKQLTPGDYVTNSRPDRVPLDPPQADLNYQIPQTVDGMKSALDRILGGDSKVFSFTGENGFRYDIMVNADSLASHIKPDRAPFLPLIEETLTDPYEVWMSFDQHKGTGNVVLRQRIIKAMDLGKGKSLFIVTNTVNGMMEAYTVFPTSDMDYLNQQRYGNLIWKR